MFYDDLKEKFEEVMKTDWIKLSYYNTKNIGILFERLLDINPEKSELPDWKELVEIKTKESQKKEFVTLFNATPNGFPLTIKYIQEKYGYPDTTFPCFKVFNSSFDVNNRNLGHSRHYQIKLDLLNSKIVLVVFDNNLLISDKSITWSFDLIKEKLERKLKYLLMVRANRKFENNEIFAQYISATLYSYKDFNCFLSALKKGYIRITFKIGVFKNEYRYGELHDRGTGFEINEQHLEEMFTLIESWHKEV